MSAMQVSVVAVMVFLNALDGFDILSISFASPGIAAEWGIDRARLGIVLSMELIGMALGSMFLGGVADRIGRRRTMLGCLVVMSFGMFMATTVTGLTDLSIWRVVTGLGIGGMLAAINAATAEFSSTKRRDLSVSLMSIGYPLGAVAGGLIAQHLLNKAQASWFKDFVMLVFPNGDWRSVFFLGGLITAILIPVVFFMVPESVHFLTQKQPDGALEQVNRTLRKMGHQDVQALPVVPPDVRKRSLEDIFGPGLLHVTVIVTLVYFLHITTFYFILKWVPKIVVDMGFLPSTAAGVLVWVNVGGATGGAVLGFLTHRFSVKALTIGAMVMSTAFVALFGQSPPDLAKLSMICAAAGFAMNGAIVGMYALFARAFPTHVRAFGTGFAIGVGRGGSVLAPIIAGFLFEAGFMLPIVAFIMALGSVFAAGVLSQLKLAPEQPAPRIS
jgi:benzoate transport